MSQLKPQDILRDAMRRHQAGELAAAESLYRQVLRVDPNNADALNLLGSIAQQVGKYEAAIEVINRAIRINSRIAGFHGNLGQAYHALQRYDEAIASYQKALALDPRAADVHYNLGLTYSRAGRFDDAIRSYREAVRLKPDIALAYGNLGHALAQQDKTAEAIDAYRQALRLQPDYAEAHYNLGNAQRRLGQFEEAAASLHRAIAIRPDYADAHFNLGNTLKELGRYDEAETAYRHVLAIRPDDAEAYSGLGDVYTHVNKLDEAVACCRKALAIDPNYADAPFYLGNALAAQAKWQAALACYDKTIELKPDFTGAHVNKGHMLVYLGKADEAAEAYRVALELDANSVSGQSSLALALLAQGRTEECRAFLDHLAEACPNEVHSAQLFAMNYFATYSPEQIVAMHRRYADLYETPLRPQWPIHRNSRDPERRLKIGYVSPDFRYHSVAYFIEPILAHHDRTQVEVYGYYNWPHSDDFTSRIAAVCDHWLPCSAFSDEGLAARIQEDGIDILVDLAGHTMGERMHTFARKPAPVQVTYLGYASTTGLSAIDYRLTIEDVDPPGNEAWYTEQLFRLPRALWCYRPRSDAPVPGPTPASANGFVTFGCTNNFSKVSPESVALWGEILRRVPDSRWVMTSVPQGSARDRLAESFAAHGVEAARLSLHGKVPTGEFMDLCARIDIALDPFPYNGTTTTCEILWQGVPVVALTGRTSVARSGYALLNAVGLSELCAADEADYSRIAAELASDVGRLNRLRQGMRARLEASPLRDEAGLARDLEQAYRAMWRKWCN